MQGFLNLIFIGRMNIEFLQGQFLFHNNVQTFFSINKSLRWVGKYSFIVTHYYPRIKVARSILQINQPCCGIFEWHLVWPVSRWPPLWFHHCCFHASNGHRAPCPDGSLPSGTAVTVVSCGASHSRGPMCRWGCSSAEDIAQDCTHPETIEEAIALHQANSLWTTGIHHETRRDDLGPHQSQANSALPPQGQGQM